MVEKLVKGKLKVREKEFHFSLAFTERFIWYFLDSNLKCPVELYYFNNKLLKHHVDNIAPVIWLNVGSQTAVY